MARSLSSLGARIRYGKNLDPRLRELAILQVGWSTRSTYEFAHHAVVGREFGVTDGDVEAMIAESAGRTSDLDPLTRAVLAGAREMTEGVEMSETTYARLAEDLDPAQLVDLVVTVGFYCGIVRVLATMQIDLEAAYSPVLEQFPFPSTT
jgi:alkylhydroperoxidase family enzyme